MRLSLAIITDRCGVDPHTSACIMREVLAGMESGDSVGLSFSVADLDQLEALNEATSEFLSSSSDALVMLPGDAIWAPGMLLALARQAIAKQGAVHAPTPQAGPLSWSAAEDGDLVRADWVRWGVTAYDRRALKAEELSFDGENWQAFGSAAWAKDAWVDRSTKIRRRVAATIETSEGEQQPEPGEVTWSGEGPRILHAIDQPGWAFDNIAKQIAKRCSGQHQIAPLGTIEDESCDVLVAYWWPSILRLQGRVRAKKTLCCVYDGFSWARNELERERMEHVLGMVDAVGVANHEIGEQLEALFGCQGWLLLEDGVDTDLFAPQQFPEEFTVGWCGNSGTSSQFDIEDLKGLGLIRKACEVTGVPLEILDAAGGGGVPHDQMPAWYKKISCYVCASEVEGTPNPLLEAMACCRPAISTRVGLAPKMLADGSGGLLTERTAGDIAAAIDRLRSMWRTTDWPSLTSGARAIALENSWAIKAQAWEECLISLTS